MKTASTTFEGPYECKRDWPEKCFVQAGGRGIVFDSQSPKDSYTTAFFEAFPACVVRGGGHQMFLRGEGKTIQDAETDCWNRYQKILACPKHEFERRGYVNGYCFCKHCNAGGTFMEPSVHCKTCGVPASYAQDKSGNWYCEPHFEALPDDALQEYSLEIRDYMRRRRKPETKPCPDKEGEE